MEGPSPGLCDNSDHGKRQAKEQAMLDIANPLLPSGFIWGKLRTHSKSQLVLFLNGDSEAYLRDRVVGGSEIIHRHTYTDKSSGVMVET